MEAPWYAQPLLLKLLSLVRACLAEEHAARNGLTYTAAAVLFTPFLLRPAADRRGPPPALPLPLVTQYTNHSVSGGALLMPLSSDENDTTSTTSAAAAPSSSVAAAAFSGSLDDSPDDPSSGLLAPLPDDFALPSADRVRAQIAAAAAGSAVVEFLLRHEGDIFAPMRRYTLSYNIPVADHPISHAP